MATINAVTRESMDMIVEEIMNVMDADWLDEDSKPVEIERVLVNNGLAIVDEEKNEEKCLRTKEIKNERNYMCID